MRATSRYRDLFPFLPVFLSILAGGCTGENRQTQTVPPTGEDPLRKSPAGKALSDDWYRILIQGKPAGFMRLIEEEAAGGNFITRQSMRTRVLRGREPVTMEVEMSAEETPGGEWIRFRMVQRKMAESDVTYEGTARGGKMEISATMRGTRRSSEIPLVPGALGPFRIRRLAGEKLKRPGDTVTVTTFYPELLRYGKFTMTLGEKELVDLPGGARRLTRRTATMEPIPGSQQIDWIDGEGKIWKQAMKIPGMSLVFYLSSAHEILQDRSASPPELLYSFSVRPDRPLQNPTGITEAVYRFTLKKGDFKSLGIEDMFRGTGQEVVREESPSVRVVRISKVLPGRPVSRPVEPPEGMEGTLAPSSYIQSDESLIVDLAHQVVGNETDAFQAARLLERWVSDNVKFDDMKTTFASALEVAERRQGDCTEHGLLLAALARAAGIPSRVVAGLVYYRDSFMGHLWTEVYIDRWVPLDGTRPRGGVGPDHIAFTRSAMETSSPLDLFLGMINVIGNLKIEILEVK